MAQASNLLEIEIDSEKNHNLYFMPLGKSVRGAFDFMRAAKTDAAAAKLINQWSGKIPGQRLAVDLDSAMGLLIDPLHSPEHKATAEKIRATGKELPAEREEFPSIDVATWLHWMRGAVESGLARIVRGAFPSKLPGVPQTTGFVTTRPKRVDVRLADAIERQNELMSDLVKLLKSKA